MPLSRQVHAGKLVLCSLCLAAQALLAQSPSDSSSAAAIERDFQAAMTAQDSGDTNRAQALLTDLHAKHPGIFAVDESLGLLYVSKQDFKGALPLLEAAVREEPSSDVAVANLGAAHFKLHRNAEALQEFQRAAELNPGNVVTQQALGRLWMESHEPERAAAAFDAALQHDPGNVNLTMDRAQALSDAGKPGEAAELLANLPNARKSAQVQSLLGDVEEKKGDYLQSAQHYTLAAELEPSESNAWMVGIEFLRHWTFDAAAREFQAGVQNFPQSTRMRVGLGAAYFGGAHYDQAVPVFADLLTTDKDNALYAELLGLSCKAVAAGTHPHCDALIDYAESHPGDARASTYAAATLMAGTADDQRAIVERKLLRQAIAADPRLAEAQYRMGVFEQDRSNWPGSVPYLEKAIALKPDLAQAHYRLALAYWRAGRKQDGEVQMELLKKYSKQQQDDLDRRLRQITTFLVDVPKKTGE
ncbi:MAG TPA: tetratricopeptide repeat protein [Terracidiphilus sp.]